MDAGCPILDHARAVYTSDSFSLFRQEYEKSYALSIQTAPGLGFGHDHKYVVERATDQNHSYKVTAGFFGETVQCCCKRFEVTGILCSHAIAVLRRMDVELVPDKYLSKWKLKIAHQGFFRDSVPLKRLHMRERNIFLKRRRIHASSDDCLRGHLAGKSWISTDAKKDISRVSSGLIWPDDHNDDECEGVNHLGSPILRHAKQIYTSEVYKLFKREYKKSEHLLVDALDRASYPLKGLVYNFEVSRRGGVAMKKVYAEARNGTVKCSCKMFEKSEILCSHALAVYDYINIVKIPHQYIVPELLENSSTSGCEKIHGKNYRKMLKSTLHMISCDQFGEGEKCTNALKAELRELSQQEEYSKARRTSTDEEMVGKVRFYDDYLIKYSTFKKLETRERVLVDYASIPSREVVEEDEDEGFTEEEEEGDVDYESSEDDAGDQQGSDDNGKVLNWHQPRPFQISVQSNHLWQIPMIVVDDDGGYDENGDEEDEDEDFTEEEEDDDGGGDENGDEDEAFTEEEEGDDGGDFQSNEDDATDQQGSYDYGKKLNWHQPWSFQTPLQLNNLWQIPTIVVDDDGGYDENGDEEDEELTEEEEEKDNSGSGLNADEDPLLYHAMEVYASDSFSLFRDEYEKCKGFYIDSITDSGSDMVFTVHRRGNKIDHCYKVCASFFDKADCCCNHFAVTGMLCSHALIVLKVMLCKHIPYQYLLKWRLKSMNWSLVVDIQKRRKTFLSLDDCLSRPLKKKKKKNKCEEDTSLLIRPSLDYENCGGTNHFGSPILIHAKQIYISEAYELFREEHRNSEYFVALTQCKFVDWRGLVYDFEVFKPRRIDHQKVHAEAKDGTIKCSCRKFETSGILCAHALAVYNYICIVKIPHQYLVHQLLKDPNMAADDSIHGPGYEDMLKLAITAINESGRTMIPIPVLPWKGGDEESIAAMEEELRGLSKDHGNNRKRKASSGGAEEEDIAGKWKLYDDHLIKEFTYKKPETKKRKVMDYANSIPTKWF